MYLTSGKEMKSYLNKVPGPEGDGAMLRAQCHEAPHMMHYGHLHCPVCQGSGCGPVIMEYGASSAGPIQYIDGQFWPGMSEAQEAYQDPKLRDHPCHQSLSSGNDLSACGHHTSDYVPAAVDCALASPYYGLSAPHCGHQSSGFYPIYKSHAPPCHHAHALSYQGYEDTHQRHVSKDLASVLDKARQDED